MNLSKLLRREIENQIEDRVVPVIKMIIGPPISSPSTSTSRSNIHDKEDEEVAKILGHMSDNGEWITDPKDDIEDCYTDYDVQFEDNFPYIKGEN